VQRAPGFPCALSFQGGDSWQNSGETRREIADLYFVDLALRSHWRHPAFKIRPHAP
jgi:hypothetical protein